MPKESTKATITTFAGTPLVRVVDGSNSRNISPANLVAETGAQAALDGRYLSGTFVDGTLADVQAKINEVSTAGGGTVWVGPGTYTVTAAGLELKSNVVVRGFGRLTKFTLANATDPTQVTSTISFATAMHPIVYTDDAGCTDAALVDVLIDGNGANQDGEAAQSGLLIINATRFRCENVEIVNVNQSSYTDHTVRSFGVVVNDSTDTLIQGGRFENCGYECVGVRDGSVRTRVLGVHAADGQVHAAQVAGGATDTTIQGCVFNQTDAPTAADCITFHTATKATMSGCVCEDGSIRVIDTSSYITVTDCQVDVSNGAAMLASTSNVVTFANNRINTTWQHGITLDNSQGGSVPTNVTLIGNTITVPSGGRGININGDCTGTRVVGNYISAVTSAIYLANATKVVVTGNAISGTPTTGVFMTGTCNYCAITSNILRGASTPKTIVGANTVDSGNVV